MAKDVSISFAGEMNELKSSLDGMQGYVKSWGASVAAIGVGAFAAWGASKAIDGATALIRESSLALIDVTQAASDAQETFSKFEVVFGEESEAMKKWGAELAETIGRSKVEINGFLASFRDLLVPMGLTADKATEMSKTLVALGADLGSFNNKADAEVINDLQAALTGSGEVMKKYGVILSETSVQQELLNMKLDPAIADEASKAQARLNIILAGTAAAQGDALRTADGFANMMKAIQSQVKDLSVDIGNELLPHIEAILPAVSYAAGEFGEFMKDMASSVDVFAEAMVQGFDVSGPAEGLIAVLAKVEHASKTAALSSKLYWEAISGPLGENKARDKTAAELFMLGDSDKFVQDELEDFRASIAKRDKKRADAAAPETPANLPAATEAPKITFDKLGSELKSMFDKAVGGKSADPLDGLKEMLSSMGQGVMALGGVLGDAGATTFGVFGAGGSKNAKDAKQEQEFAANFESLGGLFNRIQSSVASGKTPEIKAAEETADAAKEGTAETKKVAEKAGDMLAELRSIKELLKQPRHAVWS